MASKESQVIRTGSKLTKRAHEFASVILTISFVAVVPIIIFALGRFVELESFIVVAAVILFVGIIYYFVVPTRFITAPVYVAFDYFFIGAISLALFFVEPLIGLVLLFFYLMLFVIIDAVSYGWRDFLLMFAAVVVAFTLYTFLHAAALDTLLERLGFSFIGVIILGLVGFDMRMLAELAMAEERARTRLESELERLKEIDRLKTQFLDVASHQLRTPITEVRWALDELAKKEPPKEERRQLVEQGLAAAERLAALTNTFLAVTSGEIDEAKFYFRKEKLSLKEILAALRDAYSPLASQRKADLIVELPESDIVLKADKFLLIGALGNIVDNALRYTLQGGKARVWSETAKDKILIKIKDTGIGMTKDELAKMFTKFYRAPQAIKMFTDGAGLGMFYAKSVVERHGGKITAESEAGKGTTITVTLPLNSET